MKIFNVRNAAESDWAACQLFDAEIERDRLIGKIKASEIIVVENKGERIGYLRFEYLWSKFPFIALISVRQGFRNQGVGRALLSHLIELDRNEGKTFILSSSQSNESSPQSWHKHLGFLEIGSLNGINEDGSAEIFYRLNT